MTATMSTTVELSKAEAAYRQAAARAERRRAIRNQSIANALAQGMTHREIAAVTGLSRGRISQLHGPASPT